MTTKTDDDYDVKSYRYLTFDGTDAKWVEWSVKVKSIGTKQGWWDEVVAETKIADEPKETDKKKCMTLISEECCITFLCGLTYC